MPKIGGIPDTRDLPEFFFLPAFAKVFNFIPDVLAEVVASPRTCWGLMTLAFRIIFSILFHDYYLNITFLLNHNIKYFHNELGIEDQIGAFGIRSGSVVTNWIFLISDPLGVSNTSCSETEFSNCLDSIFYASAMNGGSGISSPNW